jgi:hypothetical protein
VQELRAFLLQRSCVHGSSDGAALAKFWWYGPRDAYRATMRARPARLPHRLVRRHRCRGPLVRAEFAVPSEDSMFLGMIEAVSLG